jgi:hypothetical protein
MEREEKKYGWELVMKSFDDLNGAFKIEKGKIVAWYCHESKEWVYDGFECQCGTVLGVSEFQKI